MRIFPIWEDDGDKELTKFQLELNKPYRYQAKIEFVDGSVIFCDPREPKCYGDFFETSEHSVERQIAISYERGFFRHGNTTYPIHTIKCVHIHKVNVLPDSIDNKSLGGESNEAE